jgi:hypothetical protein
VHTTLFLKTLPSTPTTHAESSLLPAFQVSFLHILLSFTTVLFLEDTLHSVFTFL